jgi:hypothetical protein
LATLGDGDKVIRIWRLNVPCLLSAETSLDKFDVFVSHASEDKPYVEPLVEALKAAGIKVWYDRIMLKWGANLRTEIDKGLVNCRYGIVVLPHAFLSGKKWTDYEAKQLVRTGRTRKTADSSNLARHQTR